MTFHQQNNVLQNIANFYKIVDIYLKLFQGIGGTMHLIKTDNKNYLLFLKCWDHDKQASWNVMSTSTTLGKQEKDEIYTTLKSLGFSQDLGFEQKFDSCKFREQQEVKNEL